MKCGMIINGKHLIYYGDDSYYHDENRVGGARVKCCGKTVTFGDLIDVLDGTNLNGYFKFNDLIIKDFVQGGREMSFRYRNRQSLLIYFGPTAWMDLYEKQTNYRTTIKLEYGGLYYFSHLANNSYYRSFINVNAAAVLAEWISK